jgi:hypothetical protein
VPPIVHAIATPLALHAIDGAKADTSNWGMEVLDTSERSPAQVAAEVATWCRRAINGQAPLLHARGGLDRASQTHPQPG